MINVIKTALLPYPPAIIYDLVVDIKNYPNYLPWCTKTNVISQLDNEVIGTIYIEYLKIKTHFTTKNINTPNHKIEMQLIDGPFKELYGYWLFTALGTNGCKIEFNLNYKFSNNLIETLLGPVFNFVCKSIMDCFIKEAQKKYKNQNILES